MKESPPVHWADMAAARLVRLKPQKNSYTCASGVTPSGTVHIGNFREIISTDMVVRALRKQGKQARHIHSWDDYDVFRKVPANMPQQELLAASLGKPLSLVPNPFGKMESYARHHAQEIEKLLPSVGISPHYIYQSERYTSGLYAEGIRTALAHREQIRSQLEANRNSPLPPDWWPVVIFCTSCFKDSTTVTAWDKSFQVSYRCQNCSHQESLDLRHSGASKLLWRVDWPMRWKEESVDFEPAGKDHHSQGGSFCTAKLTAKDVYQIDPPETLQYDFVRIKGGGGKISSSSGEVISLREVLEIYPPEIVRYLFASTRPNSEFAISFDLDVLKIYEDYDRCERLYFTPPTTEKARKKWEKQARIYELSQVISPPGELPYQISFRHLSSLILLNDGDLTKALSPILPGLPEEQISRLKRRALCIKNWVYTYAPEEFRFALRSPEDPPLSLSENQRVALEELARLIDSHLPQIDQSELNTLLYSLAKSYSIEIKDFFSLVYQALIGKETGPRLSTFLLTIGKERILSLLDRYRPPSDEKISSGK